MDVKLRGIVTLQLVNAETGEIEYEHEEENACTQLTLLALLDWPTNLVIANNSIWLGSARTYKNPNFLQDGSAFAGLASLYAWSDTTVVTYISKTLTTPYTIQYYSQFGVPPANRTIWSVGLANSLDDGGTFNKAVKPVTIVSLSSPCTQTTTQILFVTYRFQVLPPTSSTGSLPGSNSIDRAWWQRFGNFDYNTDGATTLVQTLPNNGSFARYIPIAPKNQLQQSSFGVIRGDYPSWNWTTNGRVDGGWKTYTRTNYGKYGRAQLFYSFAQNADIGTLFGTITSGGPVAGINGLYAAIWTQPTTKPVWEPVQTIFNHATASTQPFQQITAPATGTGLVESTGVAWTQPDWPEYYNVKMYSTGAVGVARYAFSKRTLTGFCRTSSNTPPIESVYTSQHYIPACLPHTGYVNVPFNMLSSSTVTLTGSEYNVRIHPTTMDGSTASPGTGLAANHEIYDSTSVLGWDSTGITIFDLTGSSHYIFDSSTTPALPVSAVRQCAVDNTGNVWVACAATGLWKVSNPKGVATVTNYTSFTNILPLPVSLTTASAYAVQVGNSNNVFAVLNGGLVRTSDGGTTWYIYDPTSTPAFTFTGITDSNWSRVYNLRVQKTSPTFRMGMVYGSSLSSGAIAWWSILGTSYAGPSISGYTEYPISNTNNFAVAASGDMWTVGSGTTVNNTRLWNLTWGTTYFFAHTASVQNQVYGWQPMRATGYVYDFYGTPFLQGGTSPLYAVGGMGETDGWWMQWSSGGSPGGAGVSEQFLGRSFWYDVGSGNGDTRGRQINNFGNKMYLYTNTSHPSQYGQQRRAQITAVTPTPNWAYNLGVGQNTRMVFNQTWTRWQEFVWEQYNWNGARWVLDYHVAATDTSGNAYDGQRIRFDTEDQAFTGRALIVVPSAAVPTYCVNNITFASQLTPQASLAGQSTAQELMSWVDLVTGAQLQLLFNNGSGNASLKVLSPVTPFTYTINGVTTGAGGTWRISGNHASKFRVGDVFTVTGNGVGDGTYGVASVADSGANTNIVVAETIPGASPASGTVNAASAYLNFGTTPALSGPPNTNVYNVAFIVNGTAASFYVNGVQSGTTQTLPVVYNFAQVNNDTCMGGNRVNVVDGIGFNKATWFYRGTMVHALLDSSAWTGVEIAAHNSAPTTYTTVNTFVVYNLNTSLAGLETKATHVGYQPLLNGITIKFTDGPVAPSFVTGEYYTYGVYDGLLQDNATSFNNTGYQYLMPANTRFTTTDLPTIPASTTNVTENFVPRGYGSTTSRYAIPGYDVSVRANDSCFPSFQSTTGDITLSAQPDECSTFISAQGTLATVMMGLNDSFTVFPVTTPKWCINLKNWQGSAGNPPGVDVYYNGGLVVANVTTWVFGDTFTFIRSGASLVVQKNGVTFHTFATPPTLGTRVWAVTRNVNLGPGFPTYHYYTLANVKITWNRNAYTVALGDSILQTGKYDPYFYNFDGSTPQQITVNIAGYASPAGVYINDSVSIEQLLTPGLNECVFVPDAGLLVFNPADATKAITVNAVLLTRATI